MRWQVIDNTTGLVVEEWNESRLAHRACIIISAHAIKAWRVANYRVEPLAFIPYKLEELNLPKWVIETLENV